MNEFHEPMPGAEANLDSPPRASEEKTTDMTQRLEAFALRMEQSRIAEYMNYLENPRRLIWLNLLMGLARGFGFAIGLGLLSAVAIYILQLVVRMNLPLISDFLVDILQQANEYMTMYR